MEVEIMSKENFVAQKELEEVVGGGNNPVVNITKTCSRCHYSKVDVIMSEYVDYYLSKLSSERCPVSSCSSNEGGEYGTWNVKIGPV